MSIVPGARTGAIALATALVVACVAVEAALADNYQYRTDASDARVAAKIVVRRADLPTQVDWVTKAAKPEHSPSTPCNGSAPKESDLVVTGDAASELDYHHSIVTIHTESQIFKTEAMASLDWQRNTVEHSVRACLAAELRKSMAKGAHLVSLKRLAVPSHPRTDAANAPDTIGYRIVMSIKVASHPRIRAIMDIVALVRGRSQAFAMLTMLGNGTDKTALAADGFCATLMASRMI
jgi:hypothetical protein